MAAVCNTLSENIQRNIERRIIANYASSQSCIKRQVVSRLAHLALAVSSVALTATDVVIGLSAMVVNMATLRSIKSLDSTADAFLAEIYYMVAGPYLHLLRVINPQVAVDVSVTDYKIPLFVGILNKCINSTNFFHRHVTLRLVWALIAIVHAVIAVINGIIGVGATALAFITLGKCETINTVAFKGLCSFSQVVSSPIYGVVGL